MLDAYLVYWKDLFLCKLLYLAKLINIYKGYNKLQINQFMQVSNGTISIISEYKLFGFVMLYL